MSPIAPSASSKFSRTCFGGRGDRAGNDTRCAQLVFFAVKTPACFRLRRPCLSPTRHHGKARTKQPQSCSQIHHPDRVGLVLCVCVCVCHRSRRSTFVGDSCDERLMTLSMCLVQLYLLRVIEGEQTR